MKRIPADFAVNCSSVDGLMSATAFSVEHSRWIAQKKISQIIQMYSYNNPLFVFDLIWSKVLHSADLNGT